MKALSALCLSLAAFAFARPAQAELKYLSYELQSGTAKELTAEEVAELNVADKRWHETITAEDGTQTQTTEMLFVQDTSISTDYYIGVFEVTQAQANLLRLGYATGRYGYAYGVAYSTNDFPFATTPTLNNKPGLTFPTSAQWLAYASDAEGKPATSEKGATNLYGGGSNWSSAVLETWYTDRKWEEGDNAHGVIDIFGNAAEYTCDPGKGPDGSAVVAFYGWPTHSVSSTPYSWKKLTKPTSPAETRLDAFSISGDFSAIWGARLVYTVPAARTYTLTVTLDGAEFSKREGIAVDESVTVNPPTPKAGQRLSGRTVTQGNLTFTEAVDAPITFTMPTSDVTIAYTTEPCGTITVEGGTATVTRGGVAVEGTEVVTGDIVTLTAREPTAYEKFVKWTVTVGEETTDIPLTTDEETQESVYTYKIPELLQGGETFVFKAVFEGIPYAILTVENGHAEIGGETVTEAVDGDKVTLVANAPGKHQRFSRWETPDGITLNEDNSFTVSGLTEQGQELAFTAVFEDIPYGTITAVTGGTATVTHGGVTAAVKPGTTEVEAGYSVTLAAYRPGKHQRFEKWTVTVGEETTDVPLPTDEETQESAYTYTIPALTGGETFAFTAVFEDIPYAKLSVVNAYMRVYDGRLVAEAEVEAGYRVTLDAHPTGLYQFLLRWDGTEDTEVSIEGDTPSFTVTEELVNEKDVTFTAVTAYYPRVLVVGGTASASASAAKGNGYYEPGTTLSLKAEEPEGYTFEKWTVSGDTRAGSLSGSAYIIAAASQSAGTTVTLTATYKKDEDAGSETVTPADIHLGSTKSGSGYTAHPLFGWTAEGSEDTVTDAANNRYHVFPYVAAGLYASLDLTTGKVDYSDSLSQGGASGGSTMPSPPQLWQYNGDMEAYEAAFEAWRQEWNEWSKTQGTVTFNAKQLPLRRVIPTDGATEFYLGVYETAMGHVENLNALRAGKEPSSSSAAAYCGKNGGDEVLAGWPKAFNTLRTNLNETFFGGAERVRYPTKNDLLRVAQTSITNENPDAGKGYPADKNLTSAMVIGGGSTAKPGSVNAMTPCYGFYGLWGNGWETDKDGNGFAGSAYFPLNHGQEPFLTTKVVPLKGIPGQYSFATFRPAIDVEEAVVIYVGKVSAATAVQVAPGQKLFADPSVKPTRAKYNFTGWTLDGTEIKAGTNYTVTTEDDGKVLTAEWEKIPDPITSVTVKCEDCLGPATAYAGQSVKVYPPEESVFDGNTPVTASGNNSTGVKVGTLSADDGTVTVTFPAIFSSSDSITLKGKVKKIVNQGPPELPSPGYRFRLR